MGLAKIPMENCQILKMMTDSIASNLPLPKTSKIGVMHCRI